MRRLAVLAFVLGCGQPTYVATGDVIAVDPAALEVTIRHEDIPLHAFLSNRFGRYYATEHAAPIRAAAE